MRYRYVKKNPKLFPLRRSKIKFPRYFSFAFIGVGIFLLAGALLPIIYYQLLESPKFYALINPSPSSFVLGEEIPAQDYTKVSDWFPNAPRLSPLPSKITDYTLSIPKLGIKNAKVKIGGEDLKKSLVQYSGTALPGQFGNTVIFGHSVLPQFYNPKNYITIFSTLPTLKVGNEIFVDFDGILYKYQVEQMYEINPSDISLLEQRYDGSYLSLITCVPPGTKLRRLVVLARLEKI